MSGKEDILIPPEESRALLQIKADASFKIIEDAAHSIHAEQPEAFADSVIDFINQDTTIS